MKIERKLYAFIISMILLGVVIGSIYADRTITDSSDDIFTKIVNSKGNTWEATVANLRLALSDVGSDGWVEVPPGTYTTSASINLTSVSNVRITGSMSEIKVSNSASFNGAGLFVIYGCDNIIIEGFILNGNHPWNTSASDAYGGISLRKTSNSTIRNNEIHHVLGDGIVFSDGTELTVDDENSYNNSVIYNNIHHIGDIEDSASSGDAGIRIMGNSQISNNVIAYNRIFMIREHGIKIYGYGSLAGSPVGSHHQNRIIGNDISFVNMAGYGAVTYGSGIAIQGNESIVSDNIIKVNKYMEHGILSSGHRVVISDNIVRFIEAPTASKYGIYAGDNTILGSSNGTVILGNRVFGYGLTNAGGIVVDSNLGKSMNSVQVIGNYVERTTYGLYIADNTYIVIADNIINVTSNHGIYFHECTSSSITGNSIYKSGGRGISADAPQDCIINDNIISDTTSYALFFNDNSDGVVVSGNRVLNTVTTSFYFNTAGKFDSFDISHNYFSAAVATCMVLDNVHNSTVSFNHFVGYTTRAIYEYTDCRFNIYIGNNGKRSVGPWTMSGVGSVNSTNLPAM